MLFRRHASFALLSLLASCWLSSGGLAQDAAPAVAHETEPVLTRVLFGSCVKQDQPVPIFDAILARQPELFLFLGDNIYADTTDMELMRSKYAKLGADAGFQRLLQACPVMATWDDHDYGGNDAGAEYPLREQSQQGFLDFWGDPADSPRRQREGIYDAQVFGPAGKRVQVIMLDVRYFRGPLKTGPRRLGGPYVPEENPAVTMLGAEQWAWLEEQLRVPAEVRLIASGIQCVSQDAGHETWSNLPHERQRLFDLIAKTGASGVLLLSGDRHWAELSVERQGVPYPLYDLTSSSLNQLHPRGTPTDNRTRAIAKTYHRENFGEILIDWASSDPQLQLRVLNLVGEPVLETAVSLSELRPAAALGKKPETPND